MTAAPHGAPRTPPSETSSPRIRPGDSPDAAPPTAPAGGSPDTAPPEPPTGGSPNSSRYARYFGWTAGLVLVGVGAAGLLRDAAETRPAGWALWFAGVVLAHDLLLVPLVLGTGALLARLPGRVSAPWRGALRAALVIGGCVGVVATPVVLGYGRRAANPSILPLDYPAGLLAVLALVALGTSGAALVASYGPRARRGPYGRGAARPRGAGPYRTGEPSGERARERGGEADTPPDRPA